MDKKFVYIDQDSIFQLTAHSRREEQEGKTMILSDDLTGAMETGVQLVKKGLKVGVVLDAEAEEKLDCYFDAVVLNTDSRNIPPEAAYHKVRRCVENIKATGGRLVYKKVDSTLRGNIGSELEAVMERSGCQMAVFAPALPFNGRITKNGFHFLYDRPLTESEFATDPFSPVNSAFIPERIAAQTFLKTGLISLDVIRCGIDEIVKKLDLSYTAGDRIVVADAENEPDLKVLAQAIGKSRLKIMPCGSAGLLAHMWSVEKEPVLVVSGSPARASKLQIDKAEGQGIKVIRLGVLQDYSIEAVKLEAVEILLSRQNLILDGAGAGKSEITEAYRGKKELMLGDSCRIQAQLGSLVERILSEVSLSGLMILGGDTAVSVCKKLGAYAIEIKGEVEPLVPQGLLIGGSCGRMPVVTKAGGFGSEDIILKTVEFLEGVKRDE